MGALFRVRFTQIYYSPQALTSLRKFVLDNQASFHTPDILATQDTGAFWEGENFIKFPSTTDNFCNFLQKVSRQPQFLFQHLKEFKTDFNKCKDQKNVWSLSCLLST